MEKSSENIRETYHDYTAYVAILLREIELLERITPVQAMLREAVLPSLLVLPHFVRSVRGNFELKLWRYV